MPFLERWKSMRGHSTFSKIKWLLYKALWLDLLKEGVIYGNGALRKINDSTCAVENYRQPKEIVCITGFGHSGSGAVIDLLSEYDCTCVEGYVDKNGSLRKEAGREFDILRHAGGIFCLENAVQNKNPFVQDASVKLFLALIANHYDDPRCSYRDVLVNSARRFLEEILDFSLPSRWGYDFCPHMTFMSDRGYDLIFDQPDSGRQAIFFLRDMPVDKYRLAARRFLALILGKLASDKILVLDQAISDGTADMQKYQEYLENMKLIAVWRDPRDVFVTANIKGEAWIPRDVHTFIKWYGRIVPYLTMCDPNYKLIRFEELVLDYDNEVSGIEEFIGLDFNDHIASKSAFDPDVSSKNIGIYKQHLDEFGKEIKIIEDVLRDFLFNELEDIGRKYV